jgi:prepilin-type N-terminal cleavage/methylation domain-containing protein
MRSSRVGSTGSRRLGDQRGLGLVEVLVASAILGVSLAVMFTNMSTMVVGARVADRRTGEERLVRNEIEMLMATTTTSCSAFTLPNPPPVDGTTYTVKVDPNCSIPHYVEYKVTAANVNDPVDGSVSLSVGRYVP